MHCRKAKQSLLTDGIQALQMQKKKGKGVNKAVIEEREKQVIQQAILASVLQSPYLKACTDLMLGCTADPAAD